jgi:class 3 adenylate cyclase/tetratricopeptide (TPR) repeat protein
VTTEDSELTQLRAAIAALEAQRAALGDAVLETALGPLREKLAALEAQAQPEQQRKLATVLFMDIAGHTALIRDLDPEENMALIDAALARLAAPVGQWGGHVARYQGDGFKAVFGLPTAHEDDPANAVRAALDIQAVAHDIAAKWKADRDLPGFAVRIGLDTGLVFAGGQTEGEDTVKGLAVNLAARLESAAAPGTILISHNVYRHVRGVFDVQPREPLVIKGLAEPALTYIVERAKPRAFRLATRGVEGIETRMVGRDRELGLLQDAYIDALASTETRVVTVVGEAGMGKSRLLYEFDNWLELRPETVWRFKGRATPHLQNVPHSLFRDLFAYGFEIRDSDSAAVALDKFRRGMAAVLEPERADVVGHWLGFDFSSSEAVHPLLGSGDLETLGRAYLMLYFRALTAAEPMIILLEDLHWTDEQSLDLVVQMAQTLFAEHLLVVGAGRPAFLERRPDWGAGEAAFRTINLEPLSEQVSRILVDEVLQRVEKTPDSLRELIIEAAEGNPFYVEEMVKMLIDQGVIERRGAGVDEKWYVRADRLAGLRVPPTLTGLLQARLDGLPRPEREALQRASVVGRIFWDDCVADLAQTPVTEMKPVLDTVRERELIFHREQSSFVETDEYIFKHALLRDVTYETVLLRHRAAFHGRVARWLEEHAGERQGEYLGLTAEHYVLAGEGLRAAALLERAGDEAAEVGINKAARRALERALALREAAGETESPAITRTAIALGSTCWRLGDYPAADAALERGLAGALAARDRAAEAEARAYLAMSATTRGHYERAGTQLEAALPAGRDAGGRALAVVLAEVGSLELIKGNLAEAEASARELLELTQVMGDLTRESLALTLLGAIASARRDLEGAGRLHREALALARRANNPYREALALVNLGDNAYLRGDYAAAGEYARSAQQATQELGDQLGFLYAVGNLAQANLKLGDLRAARGGVGEVLRLARQMNSEADIVWAVFLFGQLLLGEGKLSRGLALFGLARAHPALESQFLVEIDEELAQTDLSPAEIEAGLAAGTALDFETVVGEILAGKW